jgi:hypothetical protein
MKGMLLPLRLNELLGAALETSNMKHVTKKEFRRQIFKEVVDQTLRDFQQDKFSNTQVCVG